MKYTGEMMPLVQIKHNTIQQPLQEKSVAKYVSSYPEFGFTHYATVIVSIASFRYTFLNHFLKIAKEYNLTLEDEEYLYDWLVTEALNNVIKVVPGAKVAYHYRHDIYKCVYETLGAHAVNVLSKQLQYLNFQLLPGQKIKVLVAGDNLFIVKGIVPAI